VRRLTRASVLAPHHVRATMRYGVDRETLASTFARVKKSVIDIRVSCEHFRVVATHTAWLIVIVDSARV
jgi:hypothetical protein